MTAATFSNFTAPLLIVGPIYNQLDRLSKVEEMADKYNRVIINSGLLFPQMEKLEERIARINETLKNSKITYLIGKQDLNLWAELDPASESAKWISQKHNVAVVEFTNKYRVVVVDGGITPGTNKPWQLNDNIELSFLSDWHDKYNGNVGFVVSNRPLGPKPKPYRFSMRIGDLPDGTTYALDFNEYGLNRTILL